MTTAPDPLKLLPAHVAATLPGAPHEEWGDGRLMVADKLWIAATLQDVKEGPRGCVASVKVEAFLQPDAAQGLLDGPVGVGATPEAAVDAALRGWCDGVLRPLRDALALPYGERVEARFDFTQVHQGEGQPDETVAWDVFAGPLQVRGAPHGPLVEQLIERPPFQTLAEADALPALDPDGRVQWVRIFAARHAGHDDVVEVSLDNEPWGPGVDALTAAIEWPEVPAFLAVRQVLVLVRRA